MKTISFWCLSKRTLKGLLTPSVSRDGDPKGIALPREPGGDPKGSYWLY
ncbi:MAG: hypothetical protein RIE86_12995 [Imperialibacter sp.]